MTRRIVASLALGLALASGIALGAIGRQHLAVRFDPGIFLPARHPDTGNQGSAERNLFPAPRTALLLANELELDPAQRRRLHQLRRALDSEAMALRNHIRTEERRLDLAFAEGNVDSGRIEGITARIGTLQARLRAARLQAHLDTRDLLSAAQLLRYAELRGFEPSTPDDHDELDGWTTD